MKTTTVLVTDLMPGDHFTTDTGHYNWTVASEPRQVEEDLFGNGSVAVWTVVDVDYDDGGSDTRRWIETHGTFTLTIERESEA